ncbi:type II toxin-antitoxin system ParD family antitoxin [Okeania sp. KiyG1]|uniref:type II toxin-antitoxin system ParD family antitoxin n=1 Tax=Okeania sp. KiyG1 TaxID=2720165 RepID=UPI00192222E8|nr:type II toxin-antitoxin system ParD family antitoxin [Okeania sp. KiyG1]GGA22581.1 hypothetical protein CYANOKiyG1_37740 [Okeania sp. KiyG1]
MNIVLTPDIEQFVKEQIKSGNYQDALAVIREGLQLLADRERIYQGRFQQLKQEVEIGIEELKRGEIFDGEAVFDELEEDIRQIEIAMEQRKKN